MTLHIPRAELRLGIDFGTSNSAMACSLPDGEARLIPLEGAASAMSRAIFFNTEEHRTQFGREAVAEYLAGTEGRLMRSLKSLLGSALMQEKTAIGNQRVSFQDIIGIYLQELARRALADDILATTGVHVGGTDFDQKLSLEKVMPLLGYRHLGPRGREVPSAVFHDLATWHLINWRYSPAAAVDLSCAEAGLQPGQLDAVCLTGGSSALRPFR